MDEETYQIYLDIDAAVHNIVDRMTEGLSEDQDEALRQVLTEQFRFWRR